MPPVATEDKQSGAIRPTLFIGLGGTGKEVLLRLRRKFYEDFDRAGLPCVSYLWFDTDIRDVMAQGEAVDVVYDAVRFTESERVALLSGEVGRAMSDVFENKARYEHIHRWLYSEIRRYGREISDGAGNVRAVGRLTFFYKYAELMERVALIASRTLTEESINATQKLFATPESPGPEFDYRPQAIVLFSVAGGTGGGTFLDVAFLLCALRNLFDRVSGICVLPNLYFPTKGNEQEQRSYANAYAALKELEYHTIRLREERSEATGSQDGGRSSASEFREVVADFEVEWEAGREQRIQGPPFKVLYMLEPNNEAGVGLESRTEFFRMIAESLYMDFMPGAFSTAKRSNFSNVTQYLSGAEGANARAEGVSLPQEFSRRYASFGMSKIEIPIDTLRGACAAQLGADISAHWARACTEPDILGTVNQDIGAAGLTLEGVIRRFDTGWREKVTRAIDVALAPLRGKAGACTMEEVEKARVALTEVENQYFGGDSTAVNTELNVLHGLKVKVAAVSTELEKAMEKWLVHCLEEQTRGLRGLLVDKTGFLARLSERLDALFVSDKSECARRRDRSDADAGGWQTQRDGYLDELTVAVNSAQVGILRQRALAVSVLSDRLKDAEVQSAVARVDAVLCELCRKAVTDAVAYLHRRATGLRSFLNKIEAMAGPFLSRKESLLRPGEDVLFIRIYDHDRDWPQFYSLARNPVSAVAEARSFQSAGFNRPMNLLEIGDRLQTEGEVWLSSRLKAYCDDRFTKDFRTCQRDKDVLKHPKFRERSIREWAMRLARAALPRSKRDEYWAGKQVAVQRVAYLGLPAGADTADTASLTKEINDSLIAFRFPMQVLRFDRMSEVFLYTVSYAFPLPTLPIVSRECHDAYYAFYRALREGRNVGKEYFKIPVHIDKRWEGRFEDLTLYTEEDARKTKEALEVLLFGSILKVVARRNTAGYIEYCHKKVSIGRITDVVLGNRKEAIDSLKNNGRLRNQLLEELAERERMLGKDALVAYSHALMYLPTLQRFGLGTPEHMMLEAKHKEVTRTLRSKEVAPKVPPDGCIGRQLRDWVRSETGEALEWPPEMDVPVVKSMDFWVYQPGE